MPSDTQVIYSMVRVGRIVPPSKQVLRDISLGFYYGAKIGVLGLNGAGKSTLLRIIAGVDQDYIGEIAMSKGYSVGLLEQEPVLDEFQDGDRGHQRGSPAGRGAAQALR